MITNHEKASSTFLALDVKNISTSSSDKDSNSSPKFIFNYSSHFLYTPYKFYYYDSVLMICYLCNLLNKFQKSSTRKGSQRTAGGAEVALVIETEPQQLDAVNNVHVEVRSKSDHLLFGPSTPTASGRLFRRSVSRRLLSRWLDPRRVLFLFATLSSMGTLLLLYFTLSMGKISIANAET